MIVTASANAARATRSMAISAQVQTPHAIRLSDYRPQLIGIRAGALAGPDVGVTVSLHLDAGHAFIATALTPMSATRRRSNQ
jgi:uncharacterized protein YcsI (UPF0317 family)